MKTNFKGTKGKWEIVKDKIAVIQVGNIFYEPKIELIDLLKEGEKEIEKQGDYNALLISKAPEMLEMLIKCEITLRDVYEVDTLEVKQLIKEATEL